MEKVFYLLWGTEARLLGDTARALRAERVRYGLPDVPLPRDDPYAAMRATAPDGFISAFVPSATQHHAITGQIRRAARAMAAYAVQESTILPNTAPAAGVREAGFLQVCAFAARPGLSRAALFDRWLGHHTGVAVRTQSTVFYNQNIIVRPLTDGAPAWDAIVEERFPAAALDRRDVYFAAEDDPARMETHQREMAESCAEFIDFNTITLMNCGEYRCGAWQDAPARHPDAAGPVPA